jgi:hypothetical protein
MINAQEALQITRRIQKMSEALFVPEEIGHLAKLLEEFLSQPGISPSHDTDNADKLRSIRMKELVADFEMGRQDILAIGRVLAIFVGELSDLTNDNVKKIYEEAKPLHEEGLLSDYLHHLAAEDSKYLTPPRAQSPEQITQA